MTSACDTCRAPGACCHAFSLSGGGPHAHGAYTFWDTDDVEEQLQMRGLPFYPLNKLETYQHPDDPVGKTYSIYMYGCRKLGKDGRCTDYENRPQLCRDYQPKSDGLCAEFIRTFKGIRITKA